MLLLWLDTLIKWIEERRKQHLLSSSSKKGEKPYPLLNKKSLRLAPNIWEFPFEFSTHFSAFFNWDYLSGSQYNVMAILKLFHKRSQLALSVEVKNKTWVWKKEIQMWTTLCEKPSNKFGITLCLPYLGSQNVFYEVQIRTSTTSSCISHKKAQVGAPY